MIINIPAKPPKMPDRYRQWVSNIKFRDIQKHGIKQINPLNEKFDPLFHEALFETPSEDQESGIVTQVIDLGYILDKRLIRPAKVGVSSKK